MQKTPMYRTSRTALALMAVASSMPITMTSVSAGEASTGLSGLAQRTIVRRQNDIGEADRLLAEGREAYSKGDYQKALDKFTEALSLPAFINKDAPNVSERYKCLLSHKCDASVALAIQYRKVGKYAEARELLAKADEISPNNFDVTRELAYLDDPIRTNPALTYEHTQNVDEVRRGLYKAEGNFNLGKFDEAKVEYQNVLRADSYNTAARRGLERVSAAKSDYYRAAYDDARADLLGQVDAAWQLAVPVEAPPVDATRFGAGELSSGVAYITDKLKKIIIPRIDFEDTTVEEAIDFLRLRAGELDTQELEPSKKGVNFVIRRPRAAAPAADAGVDAAAGGVAEALPLTASDPGSLRVRELRIRNVPLAVALKYICDQTKLRYKVDDFAVTLVPQAEQGEDTFTRSFTVPPDFQTQLDGGGAQAATGAADPFSEPDKGAAKIQARAPITELLKRSGVEFKEGASANLSNSGVLLVTNTPTELDKIEQLVSAISGKQPKQVKVSTKFVEISQENGEELGFDWIVGPFFNSASMVPAGGTIGNGTPRTGVDFSGPLVPGVPAGNTEVTNIVTAGNRSGDGAINRNSIDSILNNPNRSSQTANVAPGIMSLTGLFSDSQVKLIMRGLSQKKGTDLMTAPSVTARSGQKATIEIIREFIYPTEYEPPEIPTSVGTASSSSSLLPGGGGGSATSSFPVTPATPTAFQTRNTGITLEIEPTIGENDFMIDLRFAPEIVEFEGFINYGSPIQSAGSDALGNSVQITLTENRIEMPVFSTRRVSTSLTIYDGYTVAIGGLMREDVQNVEDKVPILGDIPVIGRLFQTKAENRIKSNLIIFVTAQIIDPTGRPLRGVDAAASVPTASATGTGDGSMDPIDLPPL
ncbi:MAG: type II and III secretion system protein [Akkermansiaceae bacterium]|nr:type II and III secretion system protein [Akkermansiaceae bacterium]